MKKYDIRFKVDATQEAHFWIANAAIRKVKGNQYVPLSKLLNLDTQNPENQKTLQQLAKDIKSDGLCDGMDAMEVYTRLDRVCKMRDADVVTITVTHELEDVVEIFSRLNSRGTRVTEADIYLGVVAARTPGWVQKTFLPYLKTLADAGFDTDPNLLFRSLAAVGSGKVRFKYIPSDFWNDTSIVPCWKRTTDAWQNLIARFRQFGILSNNPMPTQAALVTAVALLDKFPSGPFESVLYWFLQASRFSRYSGSGATALEEDLRDVQDATSQKEAVQKLLLNLNNIQPLEADDFLRDYTDTRFGRFLLYLLAYRNQAVDWDDKGHRLGFEGVELLADFRPQWHHVFPRKYLEGKVADDRIEALANIAVIGPTINIRISDKAPLNYIERYKISEDKLKQQYISNDVTTTSTDQYETWLIKRANSLAKAGNDFLESLKVSL